MRRFTFICALLFATAGGGPFGCREKVPAVPFDRETWVRSAADPHNQRFAMAKSLVRDGRLRGKSRDEVISMLGESLPVDRFPGFDAVYSLCCNSDDYMPIDPAWLVIRFDNNSKVETYRIIVG